jgi:hypothetical protein
MSKSIAELLEQYYQEDHERFKALSDRFNAMELMATKAIKAVLSAQGMCIDCGYKGNGMVIDVTNSMRVVNGISSSEVVE